MAKNAYKPQYSKLSKLYKYLENTNISQLSLTIYSTKYGLLDFGFITLISECGKSFKVSIYLIQSGTSSIIQDGSA